MLLGLLRLEDGIAHDVLTQVGLRLEAAREVVGTIVRSAPGDVEAGQLPWRQSARDVLARSSKNMRLLGHTRDAPEQLLLALIAVPNRATEVLGRLRLSPPLIRELVLSSLGVPEARGADAGQPSPATDRIAQWIEHCLGEARVRLTTDAEQALHFAFAEAQQSVPSTTVQIPHLLLGLLREEVGIARRSLRQFEVFSSDIRAEIARVGRHYPATDPPFDVAPEVDSALRQAVSEGLRLLSDRIESGHILLGISARPHSDGYHLLARLTGDVDRFRIVVEDLLHGGQDGPAGVRLPS